MRMKSFVVIGLILSSVLSLADNRPEISWSIMHPVAIDVGYMKRVIAKAAEYGNVDSFELCGLEQIGINALSLFEKYPHAAAKVDRAFVEKMRADMNAVCALAHEVGKPVYFWHRENLVPKGIFEDVPELLDADGEFDLLGKAYGDYLRYKIDDVFRNCPGLDGLVLTLTESEYSVLHNSNQRRYPAVEVVRNLVGIFTEELGRRGKRFILRSFGDGDDHTKIIDGAIAASRDAGVVFEIETKVTEADFVPWLPKNKYLRRDRPLALGAECDALGEFLGAGHLPAAQVHRIKEYVDSAREEGAARYAIRIDRKGFSIFDSAHEVNLYAYMRFIQDPTATADGVIAEYAAKRFGAAAKDLEPVLKSELELVRNMNYVCSNLTFHAFPITRDFKFVKAGGIFSLYRENEPLADMEPIWSILSWMRAPTHARILAEKDLGVRLAQEGLAAIERAKDALPPDEYARQHRAFANAVTLSQALRGYTRCVVAYFEDMKDGLAEPRRLAAASAEATRTIDGLMGGPLDRPYLDGIGFFCRELLREYRIERSMRLKLERPDVCDFVLPGCITDDGRVIRLMHAAYPETKDDRIVRYAGNNRFPIGRITVKLRAPESARIEVVLDPDGTQECDIRKSWAGGIWTVSVGKKGANYPGVLSIAALRGSAITQLPGEDGTKPAISPAPFPDRMSAYVWRNWGLVDKALLAETVGAKPEDLTAVAEQMGLEPDPVVLPEWKKKGYITIIRRNWHLLPYDQILKLIGKTRDELYFCLMEDDFLWIKLGSVKPKCEALLWSAGMREEGRGKRERLAAILKEEGLDPRAPEEPRFQFVKDISAVDPDFKLPEKDDSPYDFRLIFSYFANYADPLGDPEIGSFPEGLLQKLAVEGVNAVWMHTVLRTLVKDPKYPEFGEGCENRLANLQKLVERCRKYGIRVFLYMNEPRGLHPDFFRVPGREKLGGATAGELQAMCTLNPETQRWLSDSLEKVFSSVHGLGGIFTITASENLSNCATRPGNKETCPVCKSHTRGEIIAAANIAMVKGMLKGDPNAEALIWNWAWPKEEEADIVARLPKHNCRLMAVSENRMKICRGGVEAVEGDYSISIVGPGENAKRFWGFAKENGIPAVAKVQAGNSWEISSFPYIPTMDLVAEHASNIANEGVNGVMLSWSLGCCPSPNLSVYRELRKGETDKEGVLDRLAKRLYGDKASRARKAWTAFSEGFTNYPFTCSTIYAGPHHWGPANPLYPRKTGYRATMVGIPYDDLDGWRSSYPGKTYAELIGKVADGFAEGCRLMEGVAEKKELDMFRAEQMQFASCRDQALFVMARDSGDTEGMRKYAKAELERAKAYWPIIRADSRIGFESSNQYYYVPHDLLEKVLSCRAILD